MILAGALMEIESSSMLHAYTSSYASACDSIGGNWVSRCRGYTDELFVRIGVLRVVLQDIWCGCATENA